MRYVYLNDEGGVSVVVPAPGIVMDHLLAVLPSDRPWSEVPVEQVPSDRTYRNAWVFDHDAKAFSHDMPKAREIHKGFMRAARAPLLSALDVAYARADEKGQAGAADKAQIAAQKQALRDVTADAGIAAATTPDELKGVWPSILGPKPYGGA